METEQSILESLPKPEVPEVYFEAARNKYWKKNADNHWVPRNKDDIIIILEKCGFKAKIDHKSGKKYSEAEYVLEDIRENNSITFAGAIAGQKVGVKDFMGSRYLVTREATLVEPIKGDWSTIKELALRLFGEIQLPYVYGWSQNAVTGLYGGRCKRGQILVLAGGANGGKSFWQKRVVTPILGGRFAKPAQYMLGGTGFNEDIICAEHLMLEDENAKTDMNSRRDFGNAIKTFTVNTSQRLHAKGKDAVMVESSHHITMSLNDDMECLQVLPPIDPSLEDKIQLIKCGQAIVKGLWPLFTNEELEVKIDAEIPAFIWYLLNEHSIPEELRERRMGVVAYQHPDLKQDIMALSPEVELDACINLAFTKLHSDEGAVNVTSSELVDMFSGDTNLCRRTGKMFGSSNAVGKYLERLARGYPHKYARSKDTVKRGVPWKIDFKHNGPQV